MAAPQKITDDQLTDDLASGLNQSEIAAKYGMSKTAVHYRMKKKGNKKNILPPARTKNNPPQRKSRTQISAKPAKSADSDKIFTRGPGQPRLYETVEDLQDAIDDYFNNGVNTRQVVTGKGATKKIVEVPIPTITGLILYMGYADRKSFYELEGIPEYSHTIKKARTFIERNYEEMLATGNTIGAIFALKNFGWIDKQEVLVSPGTEFGKLLSEIAILGAHLSPPPKYIEATVEDAS